MLSATIGSLTGEGRLPLALKACFTDAGMHHYVHKDTPALHINAIDLTAAQLLRKLAPSSTVDDIHRELSSLLFHTDVLFRALA